MTARPIDAETAHRRLLAIRAHIGNNERVTSAKMALAIGYVDEVMGFVGEVARQKERNDA